ncbi:MAG: guanylate kinase [Synergistetes bacterium]|nr:MAG: Guanylate kinase [bacterium 42_11]MBC7332159.1 guanylate kinase [Synergistota bacterium]MDK2870941.1 guanylate kinase [bacterium]
MKRNRGKLFVISGPSGAGKGTLRRELFKAMPNLIYSVSVTTRKPRAGEVNGVDYFFITQEEFEKMRDNGELLEWAEVHGNLYGTPKGFVEEKLNQGKSVVLEIDVQGALQVKERFPEAVLIFILPPSKEELASRLKGRGTETPEELEIRLRNASWELDKRELYDYAVINDDVDRASSELIEIVKREIGLSGGEGENVLSDDRGFDEKEEHKHPLSFDDDNCKEGKGDRK